MPFRPDSRAPVLLDQLSRPGVHVAAGDTPGTRLVTVTRRDGEVVAVCHVRADYVTPLSLETAAAWLEAEEEERTDVAPPPQLMRPFIVR